MEKVNFHINTCTHKCCVAVFVCACALHKLCSFPYSSVWPSRWLWVFICFRTRRIFHLITTLSFTMLLLFLRLLLMFILCRSSWFVCAFISCVAAGFFVRSRYCTTTTTTITNVAYMLPSLLLLLLLLPLPMQLLLLARCHCHHIKQTVLIYQPFNV